MSVNETNDQNVADEQSRCQHISLPNHEKMSAELLVKICTNSLQSPDKKSNEILNLQVSTCGGNLPVIENLILEYKRVSDRCYDVKMPLNNVLELAQSPHISRIELK